MIDELVALRCLAEADPAAISASAYRGGLIRAIDALEVQADHIAELEDVAEKLEAVAEKWLQRASENGRRAENAEAAVLYYTTGQDRGGEKLLDAVAAYREMKK